MYGYNWAQSCTSLIIIIISWVVYRCLEKSKSIMKQRVGSAYLTDSSSSSSSPLLRVELTLIFCSAVTEADFQSRCQSVSQSFSTNLSSARCETHAQLLLRYSRNLQQKQGSLRRDPPTNWINITYIEPCTDLHLFLYPTGHISTMTQTTRQNLTSDKKFPCE